MFDTVLSTELATIGMLEPGAYTLPAPGDTMNGSGATTLGRQPVGL